MSYTNTFQGPFIKKVYSSTFNGGRYSDNPAYGSAFSDTIPTPNRRIYLIIQNNTAADVDISFGDQGDFALKLYVGQSITFDNFNAGFFASGNVTIFEAFA